MIAPTIDTSASYAEVDKTNLAFIAEYEALQEWFNKEFLHITTDPKDLALAFNKHLKFNYNDEHGIKSIKDIDASVTYFDSYSRYDAWEKIYDKYRQQTGDTGDIIGRGIVIC